MMFWWKCTCMKWNWYRAGQPKGACVKCGREGKEQVA